MATPPVPPSDLHWQAPDRYSRPLPVTGLRNDASLVMHLYGTAIVDLNVPLPLEDDYEDPDAVYESARDEAIIAEQPLR